MTREAPRGLRTGARVAKACVDVAGAAILLVALLPLLAATALAVLVIDGRPVFFAQTRVGRDGRPFTMWKFRTMHDGAELLLPDLAAHNEHDGELFKLRRDPRVTRLGRRLRRVSLDELPQLWNVITRDMSLVGPRPLLPGEAFRMPEEMVRWRLGVRPGMTGLWQVSGRADLAWRDAVRLDRHYVEHWSVRLDVLVLCRTVGAVLRGRGAY